MKRPFSHSLCQIYVGLANTSGTVFHKLDSHSRAQKEKNLFFSSFFLYFYFSNWVVSSPSLHFLELLFISFYLSKRFRHYLCVHFRNRAQSDTSDLLIFSYYWVYGLQLKDKVKSEHFQDCQMFLVLVWDIPCQFTPCPSSHWEINFPKKGWKCETLDRSKESRLIFNNKFSNLFFN